MVLAYGRTQKWNIISRNNLNQMDALSTAKEKKANSPICARDMPTYKRDES